jgi:hypothetical protein
MVLKLALMGGYAPQTPRDRIERLSCRELRPGLDLHPGELRPSYASSRAQAAERTLHVYVERHSGACDTFCDDAKLRSGARDVRCDTAEAVTSVCIRPCSIDDAYTDVCDDVCGTADAEVGWLRHVLRISRRSLRYVRAKMRDGCDGLRAKTGPLVKALWRVRGRARRLVRVMTCAKAM